MVLSGVSEPKSVGRGIFQMDCCIIEKEATRLILLKYHHRPVPFVIKKDLRASLLCLNHVIPLFFLSLSSRFSALHCLRRSSFSFYSRPYRMSCKRHRGVSLRSVKESNCPIYNETIKIQKKEGKKKKKKLALVQSLLP